MSLTQVGGAGDGGVDLRGWWTIPKLGSTSMSEGRRLRVLGQCKAERKALGPRVVRELEGVMAHQRGAPIFWSTVVGADCDRSRSPRCFSDPAIPIWFLAQSDDSRNSLFDTTPPSSLTRWSGAHGPH
jgi:hypothetical protein